MTDNQNHPGNSSDLIYALDDNPPPLESTFAAIQHVLASFVGIVTPTLVLSSILGLESEMAYLLSMALLVSGVGTYLQARKPFGIGSGMLCLQGTSFAFIGVIISAGFIVKEQGGGPEEILATIFTVSLFGALIQITLSQFIMHLKRIVTPLVTGIVITSIGISLIKVGMTDLAGGYNSASFGAPENLALGGFVLVFIIILNRSGNQWIRLSSIVLGLLAGLAIAFALGKVSAPESFSGPWISIPIPLKYGFNFNLAAFIPIAILFVISTIETAGDITANCIISKQPVTGASYLQRIKGGLLGDGVNSALAAIFNTFPNSTFSQNNGVIQLTGIASRHVALYIGGILVLLGLFPVVGSLLQLIPKPVLGGATLVMFGTVAAAGIKILASSELNRRNMLIMAVSFGVGLGIAMVPDVLAQLPKAVQNTFSSAPATAGLAAIIMSLLLPEEKNQLPVDMGRE